MGCISVGELYDAQLPEIIWYSSERGYIKIVSTFELEKEELAANCDGEYTTFILATNVGMPLGAFAAPRIILHFNWAKIQNDLTGHTFK